MHSLTLLVFSSQCTQIVCDHSTAPGTIATAITNGGSTAQTASGTTTTTGQTTTFTTKNNGFALGGVDTSAAAAGFGPTSGGANSGTFAQFVGTGTCATSFSVSLLIDTQLRQSCSSIHAYYLITFI